MNTHVLMVLSTVFLGVLGIAASFAPQEILGSDETLPVLFVQIAGAAYMGFAILNWTARRNLIGGIYSRPVALGNFLHFAVVAIALLKEWLSGETVALVVAGVFMYAAFAVAFGFVLFTHPSRK